MVNISEDTGQATTSSALPGVLLATPAKNQRFCPLTQWLHALRACAPALARVDIAKVLADTDQFAARLRSADLIGSA